MQNIKLTLAYDGSDFHGWQFQPGKPTIQGTLVEVAERLTQDRLQIHGASRTDAGVHALGQVAHFRTHSDLSPQQFLRAFNALLPSSIRVMAAEEVGPDFHSRWHSQGKTYQYRIYRGRVVPPLEHRYVLHDPYPLDVPAMARAAALFEGEHDFTSFAASTGNEDSDKDRSPARQIFRSRLLARRGTAASALGFASTVAAQEIPIENSSVDAIPVHASAANEVSGEVRAYMSGTSAAPTHLDAAPTAASAPHADAPTDDPPEIIYEVRGRSFLRYMVRKIVGTLLDVGRGRLTPADIPKLFEARDRSRSGATAPPHGLYLIAVEYPETWKL
jgi:tRNA pseudouridine38-40 synthase